MGEKLRRLWRQVGPVRLFVTLLVLLGGLWIARFSWDLPLASDTERALYDWRFWSAAERTLEQDERITLVTYNDDTLRALGKRSPLDRALLARTLRALDGLNPRAIGIDILIDQEQPEDAELISTFRGMRTPVHLAFASARFNPQQMAFWQEEFLGEILRQARSGPVRPASILMEPDPADGVMRRWPVQRAGLPPFLSNAMTSANPAFRNFSGAIDFRLPASGEEDERAVFTNLPIQLIAAEGMAEAFRPMIEGRFVMIGGDINDLDDLETPMTRFTGDWMKGLEVHAHMLAQQLDGRMPIPVAGWALWIAALGAVAAGAFTAMLELRGGRLLFLLVVQAAFFGYLPFQLQQDAIDTMTIPAFGWAVGWLFAFVGVGAAARAVGSEQRRFAQSALGKYLPRDVATSILRDPDQLALSGETRPIFALFTDLEGFTKLSHAITAQRLSQLLNAYLEEMSEIVLKHGGTLDKFVGDAIVAFWGAPIARPGDGERALAAALEMYETGQAFAQRESDDGPRIGRTRVGLHQGEVVVGNFGGEGRIQYTALGDAMNTASRLEGANKMLHTRALVSSEAKKLIKTDLLRPMGRIVVSGRAQPVEVWEPAPELDAELRALLGALWKRFDAGDRKALIELKAISTERPEDEAMAGFVRRIAKAGPGGAYVMEGK